MHFSIFIFYLIFLSSFVSNGLSWSWFPTSSQITEKVPDEPPENNEINNAVQPFKHVPFEMKSVDDRIMKEIEFTKELSHLDSCHHKVMAELRGSCSSLSEEDIGILSVQLLNCQSAVEGRKTFPCTSDMAIGECTKDMDSTIWNSYQIVSNRARAVCYQVRQQQFRFKAELTVNKLVQTSEEQLNTLKQMEVSQIAMKELAQNTVDKISEGSDKLASQQLKLEQAQIVVEKRINENIDKLIEEKRVIQRENEKLLEITGGIKEQLDQTSSKIDDQSRSQLSRHEEILYDLSTIKGQAQEVSLDLNRSAQRMRNVQAETLENYGKIMDNLAVVNSSVRYLESLVLKIRYALERKIDLMLSFLEGSDKDLNIVKLLALHILYFFTVLITLAFFNISTLIKLYLLFAITLNAFLLAKFSVGLGFFNLSFVLVITLFGPYFIPSSYFLKRIFKKIDKEGSSNEKLVNASMNDRTSGFGLSKLEIQKVIQVLEKLKNEQGSSSPNKDVQKDELFYSNGSNERYCSLVNPPPTPNSQKFSGSDYMENNTPLSVKRHLLKTFDHFSPEKNLSRCPLSERSISTLGSSPYSRKALDSSSALNRALRPNCSAVTKTGKVCKIMCIEGSPLCHFHMANNNAFIMNSTHGSSSSSIHY